MSNQQIVREVKSEDGDMIIYIIQTDHNKKALCDAGGGSAQQFITRERNMKGGKGFSSASGCW